MEPFIVSARKYRPQTFKDVVGQKAITDTLTSAISNDHLAQALLFCGPRGVGKTTCARILAKKINQTGSESADEDFAFNIFELDAASNNSVDDIRSLIDQVRIPPQVGSYKVYIIDEVHMLSQSAFNAFLKTLEEPPKHAIFILATTEKHKIIPTILSRCQIFDFKRITIADAVGYLKYIATEQGVNAEEGALHIIAQKADGAMRDALSIFDRVVSFSGKELTRKAVTENLNVLDYDTYFQATDFILNQAIPDLLLQFNTILANGFDGHHFVIGLASHFRDLMVCQHEKTQALLEVGSDARQKYLEQSKRTSKAFLLQALELANEADLKYKASKNQRLLVELCLMQMASISFEAEKKKANAIIPARVFKAAPREQAAPVSPQIPSIPEPASPQPPQPAETAPQEASVPTLEKGPDAEIPQATQETPSSEVDLGQTVVELPKIELNPSNKRVSGLSISSLKTRKEHKNTVKEQADAAQFPEMPFDLASMQQHWNDYVALIDGKGQKIMASNLQTDTPKLKDAHTIWIELPNSTMKKEVERGQGGLLAYLREKLQNYAITLTVTVNETVAQKFAFTPEEKYEKLKSKNPAIELLRKEFDLDL